MPSKWAQFHIGHVARLKLDKIKIPRETSISGCERFALEYGEDVLLLVFFIPLGKRCTNVFLLPGSKIYEYRRVAMAMLKSGLDDYRALRNLLRLQANSPDERKYHSFMKRLGFTQESVLEKFNDGNDYIMWKKIYEG